MDGRWNRRLQHVRVRLRLVALVTSVGLLCTHCGERDEAERLSLDDYAEELAEIYCAYYAACCSDVEDPLQGKTEPECRSLLSKQTKDQFAKLAWTTEVEQGCVSILRQLTDCRPMYPVLSALVSKRGCMPPDAVPTGKAVGDPCIDACQSGLVCIRQPGQTHYTCQQPKANGSACLSGSECASWSCVAGACTASGTYVCDGK